MSKNVVYLLGSGATHAVVNSFDSSRGLLTSHVRSEIQKKEASLKDKVFPATIWNEIVDDRVDIEHLISVLEANYDYAVTGDLRREYSAAISNLSKDVIGKIDPNENLYSVLFDLYKVHDFAENLKCVFTLNYEDILEGSIINKNYHYEINNSKTTSKSDSIPILKLHGSFNWKNVRPVEVHSMDTVIAEDKALWIPPGVEKRKERYPFNLLWGKAYEALLDCDTLRVIGCSLSRNDWDLIPMIYLTKSFSSKSKTFEIEVIDYPSNCDNIIKQYQYLNIKHIFDIPEMKSFLLKEYYPTMSPKSPMSDTVKKALTDAIVPPSFNIFKVWLQAIGEDMRDNGKDIVTTDGIFSSFIINGLK